MGYLSGRRERKRERERERERKSLARKTTPFAADDKASTKARGGCGKAKARKKVLHIWEVREVARSLARSEVLGVVAGEYGARGCFRIVVRAGGGGSRHSVRFGAMVHRLRRLGWR